MTELLLQGWKAQHADAEATRKTIAAATDWQQAMNIYSEWARGNAGKSLQYWRSLVRASTPEAPFFKSFEKTRT